MATLYHWDLPQPLQDAGGWVNRGTVGHFCDYVQVVLDSLADVVPVWVTMNEPFCSGMIGHLQARHAPGLADLHSALAASHHLLLAHGLAMGMIRDRAPQARAGVTHLLSDIHAASDSAADQAAARRLDGYENRWFLDPVLRGSYPADLLDWYQRQVPVDFIRDGDMELMAAPADFCPGWRCWPSRTTGWPGAGMAMPAYWPGKNLMSLGSPAAARGAACRR